MGASSRSASDRRGVPTKAGSSKPPGRTGIPAAIDPLEPRCLLAAVFWDGDAGDNLWHTPANWSNNAVPTAADDVTISVAADPTITFNATTGTRSVLSLVTDEAITFTGGTLNLGTTADINAAITLNGGNLSGGVWNIADGSLSPGTSTSNAFTNVSLQGGTVTLGTSAYLNLNGTITLDGGSTITLSGDNAYLGIQTNTTLAGTGSVVFSGTTGSRRGIESRGAGRTLTINPGVTVRGGYADLGGSRFNGQPLVLTNNGTISADVNGQSIDLRTQLGTFTNTATLEGKDGGIVSLQTTVVQGAGGTFEGVNGGRVRFDGGTISSSTLDTGDIAALLISSNISNTLTNVTLQGGTVTLGTSAYLNLNGTITLDGGSTITLSGDNAYLGIQTNTTFAGTGSVVFSGTTGSRRGIESRVAGRTLTINPGVTVRGGYADLGGSRFNGQTLVLTNNGTISADVNGQSIDVTNRVTMSNAGTAQAIGGGTLRLDGSFTNTGLIAGVTGAIRIGGTLTGATQTLDATTGTWILDGGAISNSTLIINAGGGLSISSSISNALTNVTLQGGTVTLGTSAYLNLNGTITLDGGSTITLSGDNAYLGIQTNTTLAGTGSVVFTGTTGPRRGIESRAAGRTLTINPGFTVRGGYADLGGSRFNGQTLVLTNNGTISADVNGQSIDVTNRVTMSNAGTAQAIGGGTLRLDGSFTNTGLIAGVTGAIRIGGTLTGATQTLDATTGTWILDGGAISNSTLIINAGGGLSISSSISNALTNVTLQGGTVTLGTSAYLNLNGTITLDGGSTITLSGDNAYLGIQTNTTLAGTGSVVFSGTTGSRRGIESRGAGRTLTINPGVTVRGGYADLGGSRFNGQPLVLTNNGTISADVNGQSIDLRTQLGTFTNTATLEGKDGGIVSLQTTVVQGAGGTFEGVNGGRVRFDGGTISSSTLDTGDIAALLISSNISNTLTNVTLQGGTVTLGTSAYLNLNGTITLDGGSTITLSGDNAYLGIQTNTTFAGTGSVVFSGTTGSRRGIESRVAGRTLTINPGVTVRGGYADLGGSRFNGQTLVLTNNGTISADVNGQSIDVTNRVTMSNAGTAQAIGGGTLRLDGSFTNTGLIAGVTGAIRIGGTLTGATQTLDATTGTWILDGGAISNSTLIINAGGGLSISSSISNALTNVTLQGGTVTLGTSAYLNLNGTITLDGGSTITLSGDNAYLGIQTNTTLAGTGSVVFTGTTGPRRGIESRAAGRTLTINPGFTVRGGYADLGGSRFNGQTLVLTNNGTISADVNGQSIDVTNRVTNINYSASTNTLTGGTWNVGPGATLALTGATVRTLAAGTNVTLTGASTFAALNSLTTNAGSLTLADGRAFNFAPIGNLFTNSGAFTKAGTGATTISGAITFDNTGVLSVTGGSLLLNVVGGSSGAFATGANGVLSIGASRTFAAGAFGTGTLVVAGGTSTVSAALSVGTLSVGPSGSLVLAAGGAAGTVTNAGTITLGLTTLHVAGDFTQQASGTLSLTIASAVEHGKLAVAGVATLDGAIEIGYDGYTLSRGDSFELITAATVSGTFATASLGGIQNLEIARLAYESGRVTLNVLAAGDFDGDGFVTGLDYDLFVQSFEAGDTLVDMDGDGFITGADFDLFVQAFEQG